MTRSSSLFLLLLLCVPFLSAGQQQHELKTSAVDGEIDPALQEMKYDVGDGEQTTLVYIEPSIASMYATDSPLQSSTRVVPKFNGLAGKFINMSNKKVTLHWEQSLNGKRIAMRNHNPFTASGTGTFPGHHFLFTDDNDPETIAIRFTVKEYPENLYVYDPYLVEGDEKATEKNLASSLSSSDRKLYEEWRKTLAFNEYYRKFTGRSYLANYLRDPPNHFQWRADYFGQEHWVETRETHFLQLPEDKDRLGPLLQVDRRLADSDSRLLEEYRAPGIFNMSLKVLSVAPRVFEIENFLSQVEVDHILDIAANVSLQLSSTGEVNAGEARVKDSTKTRTSFNSWVPRARSPIIDSVYRRAADLMRIDEGLLRQRGPKEHIEGTLNDKTLAEDLQLVHYDLTQEYTAHHDFGYSRADRDTQGARFATLLLYLNEGMQGGETSFPRWVNGHSFRELQVTPVVGKAVLFYSQLPDGNLDDFSQHAALPIRDGEKLINLWVWDPVYRT